MLVVSQKCKDKLHYCYVGHILIIFSDILLMYKAMLVGSINKIPLAVNQKCLG